MGNYFFTILFIFLGCTSNKDYINSVKKINLSDGRTVEEVINEKIQVAEMYQLNNSNIVLDDKMLHLLNFGDKENVFYMLQQNGVTFPNGDAVINWEIKENIENTINIIEKDMDKYKDEKINQLVDLSRDLEFELIAEKLNKNITNEDIKKIESLEIKGNQVLDNLQKKLDEVYQIEGN